MAGVSKADEDREDWFEVMGLSWDATADDVKDGAFGVGKSTIDSHRSYGVGAPRLTPAGASRSTHTTPPYHSV